MSPQIQNINQLLQPIFGPETKILTYSTKYIVPAGENYGGIILSIDVTIQEEEIQKNHYFVAKLIPENEMLGVMFNIQNTFKRELEIYIDIIPMLMNLQEEYKVKNVLDCFPKCFGGRLNNNNSDIVNQNGLILFENLKILGYKMEDRMIGFNLEFTEIIVKNLAKFHALPIALKYFKPDLFNKKISTLKPYSFGDSFTQEMKTEFCNGLSVILNEINCEKHASKICQLVSEGFQFEERFLEPSGQYLTIVHHDLWANNIMIQRNEKKIKIYDLQMASFGSLVHDLVFFLFSSVQQDVFNNYYDSLIKLYYITFINTLKDFQINTDEFSWDSFQKELNLIGAKQISHIIIMMRPIFMEKDKVQDMADMNEKEMSALHALNSRYKIKLKETVLAFERRCWL